VLARSPLAGCSGFKQDYQNKTINGGLIAMEISYQPIADLPKLAWLASLEFAPPKLTVFHGSAVECRDNWMVEGVWDGDFGRGDFHRSENFFGSGIRVEDGCVYFVPSSALVDRLLYCVQDGRMLVSNSLVLLLAFTGATLDNTHNYVKETNTILKGINHYDKRYRILHPSIQEFFQVFHENIVVRNEHISFEVRTRPHGIDSFTEYYGLLGETLKRIRDNYENPARAINLESFTTLSSGYDSPAVSTLVKNIGVKKSFVSSRSGSPVPSWISKSFALDDGRPIAQGLKLEALNLHHRAATSAEDEPYFYAVDPANSETVFYLMASHIKRNYPAAVVFTGYHGDKVWDVNLASKYINDKIIRGDVSGLRLSEARLKSGFINVAVPFIHARSVESICEISRSSEMVPWRLNTSYDRPIPRRIVESAGIDRELFGMRKKMVCRRPPYPSNTTLRKQFDGFLRQQVQMHPKLIYAQRKVNRLIHITCRVFSYARYFVKFKTLSISPTSADDLKTKSFSIGKNVNVSKLLFLWSVDLLRTRTEAILQKSVAVENARQEFSGKRSIYS
jgi:hypothetical protein